MLEKKKELSIQILKFFEEFLLPRQESETPWPQGHSPYYVQEPNNKVQEVKTDSEVIMRMNLKK